MVHKLDLTLSAIRALAHFDVGSSGRSQRIIATTLISVTSEPTLKSIAIRKPRVGVYRLFAVVILATLVVIGPIRYLRQESRLHHRFKFTRFSQTELIFDICFMCLVVPV